MRVAIVHDWLNGMRGGEKVLEALLELFPEAPVFTLFHERGKVSARIESHRIVTSWLQRLPGIYRHYRNFLPLFPAAAASLDVSDFDLVISSSHAAAKAVRTGGVKHVCYCHTPMRYIWDMTDAYRFGHAQSAAMTVLRPFLRRWDRASAANVDHFIANSNFVRDRIRACYDRDAEVIHPPVDTTFFTPSHSSASRGDFYLAAGALAPYKRLDLVVEAFNRLDRRLVVAGEGPELRRLSGLASGNVEFRGRVADDELRELYRTARALVVAAREDFGIMTVEAQACGCPVLALAAGGSLDIVQDGLNGILFTEQHADDIVCAVRRFESMTWPASQVRHQVEVFSREAFQAKIRRFVAERTGVRLERHVKELQPA